MLKSVLLALLVGPVASLPLSAAYQLVDLGIDVSPTVINNADTIVGSRVSDSGTVASPACRRVDRRHPRRHYRQRGQRSRSGHRQYA